MPIYFDPVDITPEEEQLWALIRQKEGTVFNTSKGLPFTYSLKGNEMFISRKDKSITRSTVNAAYRKASELIRTEGTVTGPKRLGTFGASYLYPIFKELGII